MPTDPQILDAAAAMLDARIGLHPDPSFRPRLARALLDVAADRAIELPRLASTLGADASLLDDLTDRVTVQETAFFRHKEHFDALRDLLASIGRDTVRVWSTACANGQEPYSIAMVLAELGCDGAVLATDVSPAAVTRAAAARYADREMAGVSDGRRRRHFEAIDGEWQVRPHVRDLVRVRRHNMLDVVPPEVGACQVVFCRNVLIYLTPAHARSFLARLADAMGPDALLFIGGAETLWHVTDRFEAVAAGGCFVYRRKRSRQGRPTVKSPINRTRAARSAPIAAPHPTAPVDSVEPATVGQRLLATGDASGAAVAFRRWTFVAPDDPAAHFHLGTALEATGDEASARRAFRAAIAALDRCPAAELDRTLRGYESGELRRLLVERGNAPSRIDARPNTPESSVMSS